MNLHPFSFIPRDRFCSIDEALQTIKSNHVVVVSMAAAEPTLFFKTLHHRAPNLTDVAIYCANPLAEYECFLNERMCGHVDFRVMFLTTPIRQHQGRGYVHYVPQHLSQWTKNILANRDVDVFWGSCSLPDARGFVSLGVGACYETEIIWRAKKVILEINDQMPFTFGATVFPINKVDIFVENHHELSTTQLEMPDDVDLKIAEFVKKLIPEKATIQLGIGGIPNAIGSVLRDRSALGVHTELINDAVMELTKCGSITNEYKTLWPHKTVGAFVYGTKELYDFVHMNPLIELLPASIVNDPYTIGQNTRMISLNTAIEIDITGQVCSESVGHSELSGVGGASDTHVGAQRSDGGVGIVVMRSTTKRGESKIVFELKPGAKISISRNDIDTVVTEYGIATLKGRTVSERALSLAAVAHPRFREQLIENAKAGNYI